MIKPHAWHECWPVAINVETGQIDHQDEVNVAIRKIFMKLPQLDRIKFHQFSCENQRTPAHMATVEKIRERLAEAQARD